MITTIEEINKIEKSRLKKILEKTLDPAAIVKAAKGVSPEIHKYLEEVFPDVDFMNEHHKIGAVPLQELEKLHSLIINAVNADP